MSDFNSKAIDRPHVVVGNSGAGWVKPFPGNTIFIGPVWEGLSPGITILEVVENDLPEVPLLKEKVGRRLDDLLNTFPELARAYPINTNAVMIARDRITSDPQPTLAPMTHHTIGDAVFTLHTYDQCRQPVSLAPEYNPINYAHRAITKD